MKSLGLLIKNHIIDSSNLLVAIQILPFLKESHLDEAYKEIYSNYAEKLEF